MSGRLLPFEQEFFRRGGGRVPMMIGLVSFEDSGGQGVAFVLDLTERKRAETSLRASEIVEAHGGTLSAAPNQPHGATFQFTVPVWAEGS